MDSGHQGLYHSPVMKLFVFGVVTLAIGALSGFVGILIASDEAYRAGPYIGLAMAGIPLGLVLIVSGAIFRKPRSKEPSA